MPIPALRYARTTPLWVMLVMAPAMIACFGSNTTQRTYFSLQYPVDQVWQYEQPRFPVTVRVQRFDSAMAYDRQEMVYRNNPHEFQYYWYKLWAAKPRKMLREMATRHLRRTNLFTGVVLDIGDRIPAYELRAEILAIEELDATAEEWYAHLAMRLELVRFEDGAHVWEYVFDERKQVYNRQPVFVVRAMSEIAEEELSRAFADLDAYLATELDAEAPPGGPGAAKRPRAAEGSGDDGTSEEGSGPSGPEEDTGPRATLKNRP